MRLPIPNTDAERALECARAFPVCATREEHNGEYDTFINHAEELARTGRITYSQRNLIEAVLLGDMKYSTAQQLLYES